jgi:methylase of polypeptide subunit release factors
MTLYDPRPAAALLRRHDEVTYPYTCRFGGLAVTVQKGVFCPVLTKTSPILLSCLDPRSGERVADMFSGSGAFALVAAAAGCSTVAVDKSPTAVACITANAAANGLAGGVEARLGDLTEGGGLRPGELFDLVIANPPLLPGRPTDELSAALLDPDLAATSGFLSLLPRHLAPGGRSYLLTSDVLERMGRRVEDLCADIGLLAELRTVRDVGYERYRVHRITHAGSERLPCR